MTHNPFVEVTKGRHLYACDHDVFPFLVDPHSIEAGRLPDSEPDPYQCGFCAWDMDG